MFSDSGRTNICHGTATIVLTLVVAIAVVVYLCVQRSTLPFVGVCLCLHADDLARVYPGSLCRRSRWLVACVRAVRCTKITHARNVHVPADIGPGLCVCCFLRADALVWDRPQRAYGDGYGQEPQRCCDLRVFTHMRLFRPYHTCRIFFHAWIFELPTRLES